MGTADLPAAQAIRWIPTAIRAVVYAMLIFIVAYLVCLAWDFDHLYASHSASRMRGWLVVAAFIAVFSISWLLGADRSLHRQFGSPERFNVYRRALHSGQLPALVVPGVWRRWLRVSRGFNRMARLVAYLVLLLVVAPSLTRHPAYHLVFASLLGVVAVWRVLSAGAKRARIAALSAEIERRAA